MKPTLGLTGLTVNAMALIAPGAFLWLTFQEQALYGAPLAGASMWFGILMALLLCYATAVSYAELSKLYPGAGSSYFYAEQAFLAKTKAFKFARLAKFFTGVELLVFESTFSSKDSDKALERKHSTASEAASLAKEAGVKRLVLTHFSARYRSVSALVKQAREVFPETFAASDGMFVDVPAKGQ